MWCNETFIYNSIAVKKKGFKYINETNICSKHNYKSASSVEEEMGNKMLKITFNIYYILYIMLFQTDYPVRVTFIGTRFRDFIRL